jgi:hypothetical protein
MLYVNMFQVRLSVLRMLFVLGLLEAMTGAPVMFPFGIENQEWKVLYPAGFLPLHQIRSTFGDFPSVVRQGRHRL